MLAIGPDSFCTSTGACAVPCKSDADCYGNEYGMKCRFGACDVIGVRPDLIDEEMFVKCLNDRIEPYINIFIQEKVQSVDNSTRPYVERFFDVLTVPGCTNELLADETLCVNTETCSWVPCAIGDPTSPACTRENCLDFDHFGTTHDCFFCSGPNCHTLSFHPVCAVSDSHYETNATECESLGFSFNPLDAMGRRCVIPNATLTECMDPAFCGMLLLVIAFVN